MFPWPLLGLILLGQVAPSAYTEEMFQTALKNDSTAPNYVLITVRDANTKTSRMICVTTNLLEGAIEREYGLSSSDSDILKEKQILLSNKDRVFVFKKPEALKNIPMYYSEKQLAEVRKVLQSKTNHELMGDFDFQRLRNDLSAGRPTTRDAYRDAIAHVLLERGILCGEGDMTDSIYTGTL
jgi:hypothetical protein